MSAAEQAVEQVADVVETVGEETIQAAEVLRDLSGLKLKYALIGAGVGATVGVVATYKVVSKRCETKFEKLLEQEIMKETKQIRDYYDRREQAREKQPLKDVVKDLGYDTGEPKEKLEMVPATPETTDEEATPPAVQQNVFVQNEERGLSTDVWNHDQEVASRTADVPYVIHKEEFSESEREKTTLTYFIQDDVLINANDQPMTDMDKVVGLENLEKFGHGSEDANVVYVRNESLDIDFEILRSGGSYEAEVVGQDTSLEHSATRRRRPPRGYDDD